MRKSKPNVTKNVEPDSVAENPPPISAKERYQMIAEAAYFRAEKRGFTGGNIEEDWIAAEAEIDKILQASKNGDEKASTAEEIEQLVKSVLEHDTAAVSEQVRTITLNAFSGSKLDYDALKQIVSAVVKGAQQGAASHVEDEARLLKDAMQGLDDALAAAAEATQLALKEAVDRTSEFSQQSLKKTIADLATLESLFIETLSKAAQQTSGTAKDTLHDLAQHARLSGTAVGERVESAVSQFTHIITHSARKQVAAGTKTLRKEGALFASLAAGVLSGIAERLQSKPEKKDASSSSNRGD